MGKDTIIIFTADHGELGGNHQMRGKGNCAYRQQNHLPLLIVHPAYPGGKTCRAVTSQIDLVPTLMALTGADPQFLSKVGTGLRGHDFSGLMTTPEKTKLDSLRPASLFNYNMLTFQDSKWAKRMDKYMKDSTASTADKIKELIKIEPDFHNRCGIRSVFDGRYRFSRYFSPLNFNTPTTYENLVAHNDLELYDLQEDPEEISNLARDTTNGDLMMAMNAKLNELIAGEVGDDDGSFLPIRDGKWFFPPESER